MCNTLDEQILGNFTAPSVHAQMKQERPTTPLPAGPVAASWLVKLHSGWRCLNNDF